MKYYEKIPCLQTCLLLLLTFVSQQVLAVAYCALRDPVGAIQTFYPGYNSYRSHVGQVGQDLRQVLKERLPYPLHFNEFGKHTLYIVYKDKEPQGLVHARTEKGDWGLDEVVWSLGLDLTVENFRFQRSRSRMKDEVQNPAFKALLAGKGFDELLRLLTPDGTALAQHHAGLPAEAEALAAIVIRSALKTIIVTQFVWRERLADIRQASAPDEISQR